MNDGSVRVILPFATDLTSQLEVKGDLLNTQLAAKQNKQQKKSKMDVVNLTLASQLSLKTSFLALMLKPLFTS